MKDLAGKVAFITGGGSGVALGQAKVFADAGMKVVIADIRQDHLEYLDIRMSPQELLKGAVIVGHCLEPAATGWKTPL